MGVQGVLHINVRLSEGGAAGVARTLASELRGRGIDSPIAYGYGPHGGASPIHDPEQHIRLASYPIAAAHRMSHLARGSESLFISRHTDDSLRGAIEAADIVHLHVVHSYFLAARHLIDLLIASGTPVVWTLHDQWILTGRCAQPGACRLYETGCTKCPDLSAYPPAKIDHAKAQWRDRRLMVEDLQARVPTKIVPCAQWLFDEVEAAGMANLRTIKNSVDREFWDSARPGPQADVAEQGRNLFVCRDLRDPAKVDWAFLRKVARLPNQRLTVVGDHLPSLDAEINHIPAVNSRHELAQIMLAHDRLLFTSQVDYYPLTIAEGLTTGLEVLALDSAAAREFIHHANVRTFGSAQNLLEHLARELPLPRGRTDNFFSPERMTDEYLEVYDELLSDKGRTLA